MDIFDTTQWQSPFINSLSAYLRNQPGIKALILYGSLAGDPATVDAWSDIDIMPIASETAIDGLYQHLGWLEQFGRILGVERLASQNAKTLRVCLAPCRRLDISFIDVTKLPTQAEPVNTQATKPFRIVWSDIPLEPSDLASLFSIPEYQPVSPDSLTDMEQAFWFKVPVAIAKTMRNDLLIAMHLALDLARDCLVLQMIHRDETLGTNVHRVGGFGNEIVADLHIDAHPNPQLAIVCYIEKCARMYDELHQTLNPAYQSKLADYLPVLEHAKALSQG